MASETESSLSAGTVRETLTSYRPRTELAVLGVTLLALVARLFELGARVAHQDEARVAYWAYRYMETGVYEYRPIVHGPFLTIVNGNLFGVLGANDFTMRLVVALVGGLLPLSALLFRERLRDSETVAMAVLLAATPLLLYYSRFYRNDLLLAGFMLVAFGFFVRAYDHRRPAFLYAGTAAFALAFTTKENALVYVACWIGAAALLWDHRLFVGRAGDRGLLDTVWTDLRARASALRDWWPHLALAVVEFFAIVVFFYAPRKPHLIPDDPSPTVDNDVPGLYEALGDPTLLPALVEHATIGSWNDFVHQWGGGNEESYLGALEALWPAIVAGAAVVLALAVLGFVIDRYAADRPRDAVAFASYWGFASLLGYPVIVDNPFPWEPIHVVVPLVVPAAVGLAFVVRLGLDAIADEDAISAVAAALVVLVLTAQVGATAVSTSYVDPQSDDNQLVQYAQSSSEMKPLLSEIEGIVADNEGVDVLYYGTESDGDTFHASNPTSHDVPPAGSGWFARLPFAWYFEAYGAETDSVDRAELVEDAVNGPDRPPVIVTFTDADTCTDEYENEEDIRRYVNDYERTEVQRYLHDSGCTVSTTAIYVDRNATAG